MRLLIAAFEFPPCTAIGAQRPYQWSRQLLQMGHDVSVLTIRPHDSEDIAEWDEKNMPVGLRLFRVPCPAASYSSHPLVRWLQFSSNYLGDTWDRKWRSFVEERWGAIINEARPEVVIVTVPAFSIGPMILEFARKSGIPAIIDFRDGWSQWCVAPRLTWLHYFLLLQRERWCLQTATVITGVTRQVLEDLRRVHPGIPAGKFHLVPNGTDAPLHPFASERLSREDEPFVIGYVGRFYYDPGRRADCVNPFWKRPLHRWLQYVPRKEDWLYRSPWFFFRSLAVLLKRRPDLRERLRIRFVGTSESWLKKQIKEHGLEDMVELLGRMSQEDCLQFQQSCDALLLTSAKVIGGRDYCIAGKSFEYLASGRPVVGFVTEGEQRDFLAGAGIAILCDPDQPEVSAAALEKLVDGKCDLKRDEDFIERYKRDNTVSSLAEIVKSIISRKQQ